MTLLVFGGALWVAKEQMGERIREQVLAQYAQELYAISLVHQVTMLESARSCFWMTLPTNWSFMGSCRFERRVWGSLVHDGRRVSDFIAGEHSGRLGADYPYGIDR